MTISYGPEFHTLDKSLLKNIQGQLEHVLKAHVCCKTSLNLKMDLHVHVKYLKVLCNGRYIVCQIMSTVLRLHLICNLFKCNLMSCDQ